MRKLSLKEMKLPVCELEILKDLSEVTQVIAGLEDDTTTSSDSLLKKPAFILLPSYCFLPGESEEKPRNQKIKAAARNPLLSMNMTGQTPGRKGKDWSVRYY